jgi:hypothetical protein
MSNDKQQTAVEWLAEKYNYITWMRNRDEISAGTADEWRTKYLEQAKEMFKQQMIEFGYACTKQIEMNEAGELQMVKSPEEIYNKTDGGNK